MFKYLFVLITLVVLLVPMASEAQDDEILMLEEIVIQVAPELPTVIVTIERQEPEFDQATLRSPLERMVSLDEQSIKPDLGDMIAFTVKDSDLMLARERNR